MRWRFGVKGNVKTFVHIQDADGNWKMVPKESIPPEPAVMREFEIWERATGEQGNSGDPYFHGRAQGIDFQDACTRFFAGDPRFDPIKMRHGSPGWQGVLCRSKEYARKR